MEKSFRHGLIRRKSRTKICHDHRSVNEQQVEDITLDLFYKPHTLSLLAFLLERIKAIISMKLIFHKILWFLRNPYKRSDCYMLLVLDRMLIRIKIYHMELWLLSLF